QWADDDAVVAMQTSVRECFEFSFRVTTGALDHEVQTATLEACSETTGKMRVVRPVDVRDDQTDRAAATGPPGPGGEVHLAAELRDDLQDPQPGLRAASRPSVDHVRHGHRRDARFPGHIDHPHHTAIIARAQVRRRHSLRETKKRRDTEPSQDRSRAGPVGRCCLKRPCKCSWWLAWGWLAGLVPVARRPL